MAHPDEYHRQQQLHLLRVLPESWQPTQTGSSVLQTLSGDPPHADNSLHGGAEYRADSFSKKRQRPLSGELDRSRKRIMASSGNFSLVCRVCSKEFPSGRALGGHMRVHGGLHAEPIRATERKDSVREQLGKVFLIENCNSFEQDRDSGFEEGRWNGSGSQRSKVLLEKSLEGDCEEPFMEEEEEEEDDAEGEGEEEGVFEVAVPVSSETGYDDEELLCDDPCASSRSHSKKPRLGSTEFISNLEAQQSRDILGDGSSKSKRNLLYQLRHNPKRSRILTDQGLDRLENLAGNAAMAARKLSCSSPERARVRSCPVCGKDFGSPKALFGHMRCHPEREWRGIQPPEITSEPRKASIRFVIKKPLAVGSFDEESEIELQSDLENKEAATATADEEEKPEVCFKIKGASRTHNGEEPLKQEGERSLHGVMGEFTSKNWTPTAPQLLTGKRSKRRRPSDSQQMSSTPETVLTSETTSMDVKEGLKTYDEVDLACWLLLLSAGQTEAGAAFLDSARAQKDSEQARFEPEDESLEAEDDHQLDAYDKRDARNSMIASTSGVKYECRTCNKCFNSPQALGGHRASHKKMKDCYVRDKVPIASGCEDNTEDHLELNEWQLGAPLHVVKYEGKRITGREEKEKNSKIKGSHECSICHRMFPTGQALGGHKRRHWVGEKTPDHPASVASTNNDRQLSLSLVGEEQTEMLEDEGMGMGIDLNLPAPLDEGEDEAGYHYGVGEEKGDSLVETANRSNSDGMSPVNWRVKDYFEDHRDTSLAEMFRRDGLWAQHQSPQLLAIQFF